jgi:hypothetical protein
METPGILEIPRFGNCRIAHVVTLKIVMRKGREFSIKYLPLFNREAAVLITIFFLSRSLKNKRLEIVGVFH